MENKIDWTEYYNSTRKQPPSNLLVEALSHVKEIGKAIDIGGGALKDAKYLLQKGFDVTVIDSSPLVKKEADRIKNEQLRVFVSSFEVFRFPLNEYVLASMMHALPFCSPEHISRVIKNIKSSLKNKGIFCGQFFDHYDQWSKLLTRTYTTLDEVKEYLKDMEIIFLQEEETESGRAKHWRIYNFIARKSLEPIQATSCNLSPVACH